MNQNINSLVSRMLANATNKLETRPQQQQQDSSSSSSVTTNIKRNLFGIRLNHDQLKQDLKDMWQEQLERKKREWNFDFETLKPISHQDENNAKPRFEWNKIKTSDPLNNKPAESQELVMTTFDNTELYTTDLESSDEEDDEALAVPAFYKYQRRQKLNNGFKIIKLDTNQANTNFSQSTTNTNKPTAFSKLKQTNVKSKSVVHKPKPVKSNSKSKDSKQQNLIITYSENRKDTLRSANTSTKSLIKSKPDESAFKPTETSMKQQSLLDMLKQRKRKTTSVAACTSGQSSTKSTVSTSDNVTQNLVQTASSIVHNLRPRTISSN